MAEKKVYQEWRTIATNARLIASNKTLALWQKAYKKSCAYAGLELSGLQSKHRYKVLRTLGKINAVLKKCTLDSFDDYEKVDVGSLKEIFLLAKSLSLPG